MCFFEDLKIYSGLVPLSVSPQCECVYTMAGQTPALQHNWQSLENILRKNTRFNEHPVYHKVVNWNSRFLGVKRPLLITLPVRRQSVCMYACMCAIFYASYFRSYIEHPASLGQKERCCHKRIFIIYYFL